MYDNGTVGIMNFSYKFYKVVISCSRNSCICEAFGAYEWRSINDNDKYFDKFVDRIIAGICNPNVHVKVTYMSNEAVTKNNNNKFFYIIEKADKIINECWNP